MPKSNKQAVLTKELIYGLLSLTAVLEILTFALGQLGYSYIIHVNMRCAVLTKDFYYPFVFVFGVGGLATSIILLTRVIKLKQQGLLLVVGAGLLVCVAISVGLSAFFLVSDGFRWCSYF